MSTNTDVDAIFDLAADASTSNSTPDTTSTETTETTTTENGTETNAEASSADAGGALYPNVLRTLTLSEAGEGNPEGTMTPSEFAGYLTVEAIKAGGGINDIVQPANIYTGTKAKRHPLPVVLVFADDADQSDLKNATVYIPVAEATEAFKARPARGENSNSPSTKRTHEELLTVLAKKLIAQASTQKRYDRVKAQLEKINGLAKKYTEQALVNYKSATPVEFTDPTTNETRMQTPDEAAAAALKLDVEKRMDELAAASEPEGTDIEDNA